jgi:hypothetical protein
MAKPTNSYTSKAAWKKKGDRGPHDATLPSGVVVKFLIPDSAALIRSDKLPESLTEIAVRAAAYPGGADGYMEDLAVRAVTGDTIDNALLSKAIRDGLELRDWLVAYMLVEPTVEPEDVKDMPELDVEMLMEFAERKRDTDAKGVRLPIVMLEVFARFRDEPVVPADDPVGERVGVGVHGADADVDGSPV